MPKYNNPRKIWRYPDGFKSKAVQLSLIRGIRVKEVAKTAFEAKEYFDANSRTTKIQLIVSKRAGITVMQFMMAT